VSERPNWRHLDWRILATLGALVLLSLLFLSSAGYDPDSGEYEAWWRKQAIWVVVSAALVVGLLLVPYRRILRHAYKFYIAGLVLLLAVAFVGTTRNNARRWLDLGFMLFQPSEFMKVILIVTLARYIRWRDDYKKLFGLVRPFLLTLVPMAIILTQPDLGTAILFVPVLFVLLLVAGARPNHLGLVVLMGLAAAPVLFFGFLKEYQRKRILVFLGQAEMTEAQKRSEGYHLHRSMIAVGSGGFSGKGLGDGDQRVPENETDFLFTVIAEEWGFLGALLLFAIYAVLFLFLLDCAVTVVEPSAKLLVVGVFVLLLTQTAVNLGMTVGLAPITGLTLPFLSYGGSSLLSLSLAVGLVLNVKLYPDFVFTRDFG
jgi:rod shape-determining protein RodA